ncbi:MAG: SagB/ThcOx family dehydrogenase [candidate division NC10 bacterium]|nr:SagB/ThcOx family dehydrogenase [candidate division NC10 bacterium]
MAWIFKLPEPRLEGPLSLEEAIKKRKSVRRFISKPLTLLELSNLLWSGQGITHGYMRAAPSAGATYPLDLFAVIGEGGVEGVEAAGAYRYHPHEHSLELVRPGDQRASLCSAALGQDFIRVAPLSILITAEPSRTTSHYGQRGIRYIYQETGHVAQNISLQAVTLGLGSVVVGAFYDDEVASTLKLPSGYSALYLISIGHPRK